MNSKALVVATALVLVGNLPFAADAGKPVKPVPDNASAYPVFIDATGKVVGPAIMDDDTGVVVRLNGYTFQVGLAGLDNDESIDFSKADWSRQSLFFEQAGCVGTAYVIEGVIDRGNLGFSARALVVRDLVTQRDTLLLFPPGFNATSQLVTIRSSAWDGQCFDYPEPSTMPAAVPVGTKIDIGSLYTPPFTLK